MKSNDTRYDVHIYHETQYIAYFDLFCFDGALHKKFSFL